VVFADQARDAQPESRKRGPIVKPITAVIFRQHRPKPEVVEADDLVSVWPPGRLRARIAEALIHIARRFLIGAATDNPGRHAGGGAPWCRVAEDHTSCTDLRPCPDLNIAKDRRAGTDHYTFAYLGMTISGLLARSAECDTLKYRYTVLDNRCFTDHDSCPVIDHETLTKSCSRVDVDAGDERHSVLQMKCERSATLVQQRMCQTVALNCMISLEEQKSLKRRRTGRVAVAHGC
jgi:hypothetical protein